MKYSKDAQTYAGCIASIGKKTATENSTMAGMNVKKLLRELHDICLTVCKNSPLPMLPLQSKRLILNVKMISLFIHS